MITTMNAQTVFSFSPKNPKLLNPPPPTHVEFEGDGSVGVGSEDHVGHFNNIILGTLQLRGGGNQDQRHSKNREQHFVEDREGE